MYVTVQGPPPVSEMTYTVSSGTLNSSIPYHTPASCGWLACRPTVPFLIHTMNKVRRYTEVDALALAGREKVIYWSVSIEKNVYKWTEGRIAQSNYATKLHDGLLVSAAGRGRRIWWSHGWKMIRMWARRWKMAPEWCVDGVEEVVKRAEQGVAAVVAAAKRRQTT